MLGETTVTNTEATVYTVPSGKTGLIELIIEPSYVCNVVVKVGNRVLFDEIVDTQVSQKLTCLAGDSIKVYTDGVVNVFVSGMEV